MRGELKLSMYSQASVVAHVLNRRHPAPSFSALTAWFVQGGAKGRAQALRHVLQTSRLNLEVLDRLDLLGRTSEMARVFGIDFFSVLNRGSQYRVEAVLGRVSKPLGYVALSPR
ncbi:dna polymerase zeta subunit [Nannochloropsis gaditana]|uniref:Dna polymerase zeta subunit n=1 Tax=Nannochloropsis gaditana TaxID=72520 RepID=W7T133_9STRA|nr:dna polymerase zeta subunit [Nannochloropsis gaditana]